MSLQDTINHLDIASIGIEALELIESLVTRAKGDANNKSVLLTALYSIGTIIKTVREGGKTLTPEQVRAELKTFQDSLAADNKAAQVALDEKFPK